MLSRVEGTQMTDVISALGELYLPVPSVWASLMLGIGLSGEETGVCPGQGDTLWHGSACFANLSAPQNTAVELELASQEIHHGG